jgi:hypothetical protein
MDFLHVGDDSAVDEFLVMGRPLPGALALADAMRAELAAAA